MITKSFAERYAGGRRKLKSVLIDVSSGEMLDPGEGAAVYFSRPRRNGFDSGGFFTMSQSAADAMAEMCVRHECGVGDMAVLFRLLSVLDQHNYLLVNQAALAKSLSLQRPNVSRSIRRLIELEVLLPGPKVGTHCTYRLNPLFGWKGPNKQHRVALAAEDGAARRRGLRLVDGGLAKRMEEVKMLRQMRLDDQHDEKRQG